MITRLKLIFCVVLIGCAGLLNGCGSGSSTAATSSISGRATQSPVVNGVVFADKVVGGVSNFLQDASELATTTDANGNYSLATPSYDYILVSKDGTDKVTGLKQILMLAPKGSANITPLTTLVTLDTTGTLAKKLELLQGGLRFDSDVYTNSSPAMLMLIKSVEVSVQSLTDTIQQKSSNTLTPTQIYSIQARILQKISAGLNGTVLDLAIPANLTSILNAAFVTAIPVVTSENGNVVIPVSDIAGIATSVANNAVDKVAQALGKTGHTDATALSKVAAASSAESSLVSFAAAFTTAQSATVTSLGASFSIAASSTPASFSPPTFPVVTIAAAILTGSTGGSGTF